MASLIKAGLVEKRRHLKGLLLVSRDYSTVVLDTGTASRPIQTCARAYSVVIQEKNSKKKVRWASNGESSGGASE